jgi:hypothetical protein
LHPHRREDSGGRESVDRPKSARMTEVGGYLPPSLFGSGLAGLGHGSSSMPISAAVSGRSSSTSGNDPFSVPTPAVPRRQHQGGRRGSVLRSRQMVLREPPGTDARLPASLVSPRSWYRSPPDGTNTTMYRRQGSWCCHSDRPIQRDGCEARKSGSVRGAEE